MAGILGSGQAKIAKIERTLVSIGTNELEAMLALYKLSKKSADEIRALAVEDLREGPTRTSWSAFADLVDLEANATEILSWHSERIPGPLQAENYTRRQYAHAGVAENDARRFSRDHAMRRRVFTDEDRPRYRVILSESSLKRLPGGWSRALAAEQATHLLNLMGRYDRLEVQILTFSAPIPFVEADFVLLSLRGGHESVAYIEYAGGSRIIQSHRELIGFKQHWAQLLKYALSREETEEYLADIVRKS